MGCRDRILKTNADYLCGSKYYGTFSKARGRSMWREQACHHVIKLVLVPFLPVSRMPIQAKGMALAEGSSVDSAAKATGL